MLTCTPKRSALEMMLLAALLCAAGCQPQRPPNHYSVLAGKVVACHTDTGELTVQGSRRTPEGPADETVYCLITRDSEIYVNDRFSSIAEIQIGDAVELVGRRDPNPQVERFVVSFAYFDHPLPEPPKPELIPASAPATQRTPDTHE
jgi:hypothetical protein